MNNHNFIHIICVSVEHTDKVRQRRLTSLNIAQMISDKHTDRASTY